MAKAIAPELLVNSGRIQELSSELQGIARQIAELQAQEEACKEAIKEEAVRLREDEAAKDNFIGILRVSGNEAPLRAEFRIKGLAIPVDEDFSDFGGAELQLFEKKRTLFRKSKNEILVKDAQLLIEDIKRAGLSLNDVIGVEITNEEALLGLNSAALEKIEAYVPVDGFLGKVNGMATRLSKNAKDYIRGILKDTMSVAVVPGTKGKGK